MEEKEKIPRRVFTPEQKFEIVRDIERLIFGEVKKTHLRYLRLTAYLKHKYHLVFSEDTIRAIL